MKVLSYNYEKKSLILLMILFILSCSKDEEESYQVRVINEKLTPIEFENFNSDISIEAKLKGDTLKCKVVTIYINKNDTLKRITSKSKKNVLNIKIETDPNPVCLEDSCWTVHEVSFDLLQMKIENYNVLVGINNYYKSIDVNLNKN